MIPKYPYVVKVRRKIGIPGSVDQKRVEEHKSFETLLAASACYDAFRYKPTTTSIQLTIILEEWTRGDIEVPGEVIRPTTMHRKVSG